MKQWGVVVVEILLEIHQLLPIMLFMTGNPKISVRIGDEVQRHNGSPTVIFIFGKSCFLALL